MPHVDFCTQYSADSYDLVVFDNSQEQETEKTETEVKKEKNDLEEFVFLETKIELESKYKVNTDHFLKGHSNFLLEILTPPPEILS